MPVRHIRFWLFLTLSAAILSCSNRRETNIPAETVNVGIPCSSEISSETAVVIAKGCLYFDYNLENYEVFVTDNDKIWIVKFIGKGPVNEGFGPTVYINKQDGNREYTVHTK